MTLIPARRSGVHRGVSLAETLISLVILSIVVMLIFNLFPSSALATRKAGQRLQADDLAQSLLEERRSADFSALVVGKEDLDPVTLQGITYHPTVEVLPVAGVDQDHLVAVRATVTWLEAENRPPRSITHELWISHVPD